MLNDYCIIQKVRVGDLWYCRNWKTVEIQTIADDYKSIIGRVAGSNNAEDLYWWDDYGRNGGGYGLPEWDLMLAVQPTGCEALMIRTAKLLTMFILGMAMAVALRHFVNF
jgi:hypothetical protein